MKTIKSAPLLLTVILFLIAQTAIAQQTNVGNDENNPIETQERGTNMVSKNVYNSITFNGYTISEINATEGNEQAVRILNF